MKLCEVIGLVLGPSFKILPTLEILNVAIQITSNSCWSINLNLSISSGESHKLIYCARNVTEIAFKHKLQEVAWCAEAKGQFCTNANTLLSAESIWSTFKNMLCKKSHKRIGFYRDDHTIAQFSRLMKIDFTLRLFSFSIIRMWRFDRSSQFFRVLALSDLRSALCRDSAYTVRKKNTHRANCYDACSSYFFFLNS